MRRVVGLTWQRNYDKTLFGNGRYCFLGSALVRRLVREGYRVRVLDNESRGSSTRLNEIAGDFRVYPRRCA